MNFSVLAVVVIAQIGLFQFLAIALTRGVFTVGLGDSPAGISDQVATYLRRTTRGRFALGGLLGAVAVAALFGVPADPFVRKLGLGTVSIISSVAFAAAFLRDRRTVRLLGEQLPESSLRQASLEPRSIEQWYNPAWEVLPLAIFCLTAATTIVVGYRLGYLPTTMWALQILQGAFVLGALFYTFRFGLAVPNVSRRLASLRDRPELAMQLGERLAAQEMQYMMFAKTGVALLLGVSVVENGLRAMHHRAASLFDAASWVIVGVLILLFAAYLIRLVTLVRHTLQQRNGV